MNLDRTFCSGLRCGRATTCERWTINLQKWADAHPNTQAAGRIKRGPLSIAQFGDHDGKCDKYEPIEVETVKVPDYHGCLTGDCPHERQSECDKELKAASEVDSNAK